MSADSVLRINLEKIPDKERTALDVLASVWENHGRPTSRELLLTVLKETINRCKAEGQTYPRVLLLRHGQLTRNEFQPDTGFTGTRLRFAVPQHSKIPAEWLRAATEKFNAKFNTEPTVPVVRK